MGVYGEEFRPISLRNGMWDSGMPIIGQGFVKECINMVPNEAGFLELRGDITTINGASVWCASETVVSGNSFPYNRINNPSYLGGEGYSKVAFVSGTYDETPGVNPTVAAIVIKTGGDYLVPPYPMTASRVPYVPAGRITGGNVYSLYLNRLYCGADYRISGWNFNTASAVVETAIVGAPVGVLDLKFFKDRMFALGSGRTRIYYTNTISVGGYPETWDTAANFFDLPTSTTSEILGWEILNNMMYFYTREGVFSLQVMGLPTNWVLKKINESVSVNNESSVCVNNERMYYVADNDVYQFNGYGAPVKISSPISEIVSKYEGVGIFAFGKGVILCLQNYSTYTAGPNIYNRIASTKNLYFNGNGWSEIKIKGFDTWSVNKTALSKIIYGKRATGTAFEFLSVSSGAPTDLTYNYRYFEDGLYGSEEIDMSVIVDHHEGQDHKETRIKYGYLESQLQSTNPLYCSTAVDGAALGAEETISPPVAGITDHVYYPKISMPQYNRRLKVKIRGTLPIATVDGNPFQLRSIGLVFNTARNRPEAADG